MTGACRGEIGLVGMAAGPDHYRRGAPPRQGRRRALGWRGCPGAWPSPGRQAPALSAAPGGAQRGSLARPALPAYRADGQARFPGARRAGRPPARRGRRRLLSSVRWCRPCGAGLPAPRTADRAMPASPGTPCAEAAGIAPQRLDVLQQPVRRLVGQRQGFLVHDGVRGSRFPTADRRNRAYRQRPAWPCAGPRRLPPGAALSGVPGPRQENMARPFTFRTRRHSARAAWGRGCQCRARVGSHQPSDSGGRPVSARSAWTNRGGVVLSPPRVPRAGGQGGPGPAGPRGSGRRGVGGRYPAGARRRPARCIRLPDSVRAAAAALAPAPATRVQQLHRLHPDVPQARSSIRRPISPYRNWASSRSPRRANNGELRGR